MAGEVATLLLARRRSHSGAEARLLARYEPTGGSTLGRGYDDTQVDAFLDAAGIRLAAMESAGRPEGPLVSGAILARWAEWADSTAFPTRRRGDGYDPAEVDALVGAIRDEFHGVRRPPLTWPIAHGQ